MRRALPGLLLSLLLGACLQLPPTPQDIQAKRFELVPGKAVIYIVREAPDSWEVEGLMLDDGSQITLLPGSYYRWEVAPGTRRIEGFGPSAVRLSLRVEPGKLYFLTHAVFGTQRTGPAFTRLRRVDADRGRALVLRSRLSP
jgi:hypothetical protein